MDANISEHVNIITPLPLHHQYDVYWGCRVFNVPLSILPLWRHFAHLGTLNIKHPVRKYVIWNTQLVCGQWLHKCCKRFFLLTLLLIFTTYFYFMQTKRSFLRFQRTKGFAGKLTQSRGTGGEKGKSGARRHERREGGRQVITGAANQGRDQ